MVLGIKNEWHWQLIKLMVKQSIQYNTEQPIIQQEMIEKIKQHPHKIKKILKMGKKAENDLKQTVNKFNIVIDQQEIDATIYQWIVCEKEVERALEFADTQLKEIFWEENN